MCTVHKCNQMFDQRMSDLEDFYAELDARMAIPDEDWYCGAFYRFEHDTR
jgi:hypothetical protein